MCKKGIDSPNCHILFVYRNWLQFHRVLDTLLDLSSDLSHIPIANGPDPVLVDPAQRWSDDNNDEATTLVASQYERGFYYIEEPEKLSDGTDVPQFLNIDVEWM